MKVVSPEGIILSEPSLEISSEAGGTHDIGFAAGPGCVPWFFRRVDGGRVLDLVLMQRAIRFGHSNTWRFSHNAFPMLAAR